MLATRRETYSRNDRERRQRRSRQSNPDSPTSVDVSHSEKYERHGNLSPLRSPLREDRMHHNRSPQYGCNDIKHRHADVKDLREKINRGTRRRDNFSDSERTKGHRQDRRNHENHRSSRRRSNENTRPPRFGKEDFPPLADKQLHSISEDRVSEVANSCWKKKEVLSNPTNWADQVEQYEERQAEAQRDLRKFRRKLSLSECSETSDISMKPIEFEEDPATLMRRQKQIDFGKNTLGYDQYSAIIPKHMRTKGHPRTPDKFGKVSRRSFDSQVRIWRRKLHFYDPMGEAVDAKSDVIFNDAGSTSSGVTGSGCVSQETETWEEIKKDFEGRSAGNVSDNGSDISDDLMNLALTGESKHIPAPGERHVEVVKTKHTQEDNGFFSGFDLDNELDDSFTLE